RPVPADTVESRAIASVRSAVTNIREHLAVPMSATGFGAALRDEYRTATGCGGLTVGVLTAGDRAAVACLAREKYGSWEWNYGESPPFTLRRRRRWGGADVDVRLDVSAGTIAGGAVNGAPVASRLAAIPERLRGCRFRYEDV